MEQDHQLFHTLTGAAAEYVEDKAIDPETISDVLEDFLDELDQCVEKFLKQLPTQLDIDKQPQERRSL